MTPFLLVSIVFVYFFGIRFIGRPLAQWSWRFWTEEPCRRPSFGSYLLYPLAHVITPLGVVMQEYKLPDKAYSNRPLPGHVPLICGEYLYGERHGTSEGYMPGGDSVSVRYKLDAVARSLYYDDAGPSYIRHASWAWPLRMAILPICHAMVIVELPWLIYTRLRVCASPMV